MSLSIKKYLLFIYFFITISLLYGQSALENEKIGINFYNDTQYNKALYYLESAYSSQTIASESLYNKILNCYIYTKNYKGALSFIKKHQKKYKNQPSRLIDLMFVYTQLKKPKQAENNYLKSLKICFFPEDFKTITDKLISYKFSKKLFETYLFARQKKKQKTLFAKEIADFYAKKNDFENMYNEYLNLLEVKPFFEKSFQQIIMTKLKIPEFSNTLPLLEKKLIKKINSKKKYPTIYSDILIWLYIYQKQYDEAFKQVNVLDKRFNYSRKKLLSFGEAMLEKKQYDIATKSFNVSIKYSISESIKFEAKTLLIKTKETQLDEEEVQHTNLRIQEIDSLYRSLINNYKKNIKNNNEYQYNLNETKVQYAEFKAFKQKKLDTAILIIKQIIKVSKISSKQKALYKLRLADIYLLTGNIWEANLIYAQVERMPQYKHDRIGEEARFKGAKTSFYEGDFFWAKTQFDVLKASASKFIANDALQLSVLIYENIQKDSNLKPLKMFAEADLKYLQKNYEASIRLLDSINSEFSNHNINDDVFYKKYEIYYKLKNYKAAEQMLKYIIEQYSSGIFGDKALFLLAELYKKKLNKIEEASKLYKKLFFEFKGSIFTDEARKNYRYINKKVKIN